MISYMQNSSALLIPVVGNNPDRSLQPKPKRPRRKVVKENCNNGTPAGRRTSIYRGVTRHRWTGRYEAHLWDKSCWNQTQSKKGRQVYLGAYDEEEAAAHAYDMAALKYWGPETVLNFPLSTYANEIEEMQSLSKEEYLASLRRRSSGFSRGVSKYRGVARHHHNGRWEARIGRVFGNKYLYLGTYNTQEEAAAAYDLAAIEHRGLNAVTNFDINRYIQWLHPPGGQKVASNDQDSGNISYSKRTLISTNNNGNIQNGRSRHDYNEIVQQDDQFITPEPNNISNAEYSYQLSQPRINGPSDHSTALGLLLQSAKFKEMLQKSSHLINPGNQLSAGTSCSDTVDADRLKIINNESIKYSFSADMDAFFESSDNIFGHIFDQDCLPVNPAGNMNNAIFQGFQPYDDQMQFNQMQLGSQMCNGDYTELHHLHPHEDPLIYNSP